MKKRILVTPLNWGLGHVTRSIPLINALIDMGCEVFLASDGVAYFLLKAEYPDLPIFELPSYGMRYETENMLRNIAPRLPKLMLAVQKEQSVTAEFVRKHKIDGILSDNRYGCYVKSCSTILLTHQLHLRFPNKFLQGTANWLLHRALQNFDRVWVPDGETEPNLSGALSHHPTPVHQSIDYIGILSRMKPINVDPEYDVAVVLSAEPQRTILEEKLLEQALEMPQKFIFVQGKTQSNQQYFAADNIEVSSYLTSEELNKVILASTLVVCRSGYSSLMDLARLGEKAILIPTPGQTEQEYLADKCAERGYFHHQSQKSLNLQEGIEKALQCTGFDKSDFSEDTYRTHLEQWVASL